MENRRYLKRIKKLGNAIKRMRYSKADKERLIIYNKKWLKIKYRNNPTELRDEMKEVDNFY